MIHRPLFPLLILLGSLVPATAALAAPGEAPAVDTEEVRAVDLSRVLTIDALMEALKHKRVVFVGETHDRYGDHLNQIEIIRRMHAANPDLAIGLEFFQWPFQEALDRYIAGETDERTFLKESEYYERWRFDYRLYRPILEYARAHHIPVVALNAPAELTHKVAAGGLDALTPQERATLPAEYDRSDAAYRERLKAIFGHHQGQQMAGDFEHFYQAQLLWDEGMAATAARWLKAHPSSAMVILAGVGHVIFGSGIPDRLQRRLPVESAIVLNMTPDAFEPGAGDYLLVSPERELPPQGLMGTYLSDDDKGVFLEKLEEGGGAAQAGLKVGDRLLSIDGHPIGDYTDVKIAMLGKAPGSRVMVVVERKVVLIGTETVSANVVLK